MIFRTGLHLKLVRATFVLYMMTKWLPSYNCCKITITNFNELVLSCTQFNKTVQKENKSNQRRVKIHRILTFRKGQNNYTVTLCGDAKIYWVQLTSSSIQVAPHPFKKYNLFLYKEQIYRFHSLCPVIPHNYSELSLNQSGLLLTT